MDVSKIAIQIASEFTGSKAFKQAETSTQKLERQVKNLGRSLGIALGTAAIVRYGKASVKAFAADDNAARSLGMTLKNLHLDYFGASEATNLYISNLEKQTGVLDDELRPAMDRFLRATSSVAKSQELLNLALDISAGTGKDLTIVSQSLQKAYLGNNASLGRLGVGLTKAELTGSTFLELQTRLTQLFAGQAVSAANSYEGALNKLTVASNNAKEAIGKGLLDALTILSGGTSVDGGVKTIEKMSNTLAEGARNIAFMIKQFEALKPVIIAIGALLLIYFAPITAAVAALAFILAKGGENLRKNTYQVGPQQQSPGGAGAVVARMKYEKEQTKILKDKNTLGKIDNANTLRKLALTGDEKALAELGLKFDVERINLYAALNQTTDNETRMRLLSLIAIHDSNSALAGMISEANKTADAFKTFKDGMLETIKILLDKIRAFQMSILGGAGGSAGPTTQLGNPAPGNPDYIPGVGSPGGPRRNIRPGIPDFNYGSFPSSASSNGGVNITINNAGSVITERDLVSSITQGIYNNQASGIPINYSTAY